MRAKIHLLCSGPEVASLTRTTTGRWLLGGGGRGRAVQEAVAEVPGVAAGAEGALQDPRRQRGPRGRGVPAKGPVCPKRASPQVSIGPDCL